jgi:hypothetical protein
MNTCAILPLYGGCMKKILIGLIPVICLGQVVWENIVIDSIYADGQYYCFNAMALDTNSIPCVVYNPGGINTITFAWQTDSGWQKESIEAGFKYYGFSLVVDDDNIVHFSYYRRDDSLDMTYHCHGYRDTAGWQIEYIDTTAGYLGSYFWDITSSIALDTAGLPGIAYTSWNVSDSLHYIKYAHYNGVTWDTSVVVRDTTWHLQHPLDWSPSLGFNNQNSPQIVFHRIRSDVHVDTIKIAHYDDTLNYWVVEPVMDCGTAGLPISLKLDSHDYPCIAHGYDAGLAYTWWDGSVWHTDYSIASIGWIDTRIRLALDSLDQPHILYKHWGTVFPRYCYKDTIWHMCGPVEPDTLEFHVDADLNLVFGNSNQPHISYKFVQVATQFMSGFKYAKGTFTGVEEYMSGKPEKELALLLSPNPCSGLLNIEYSIQKSGVAKISIYDVTGARIGVARNEQLVPGYYEDRFDVGNLPGGVYFVVLKQNDMNISKKFLIMK